MRQLLQSLRNGEIATVEVPVPARPAGHVLVANRASLISSGTEGATVNAARASLLGKARQRPDQVRQVLDNVRREGLTATIVKVRDKLDRPKALGYSTAGVVLETDPDDTRLRVGDPVACGGADHAVHAEVISVPRNLVVPVPDGVGFERACFATVGAIALQGVRRAGVQLGDRVLVIGLGLIGQLTWQLLADAGCVVVGTDVRADAVERARSAGLQRACLRGSDDVEAACSTITDGRGVDAVIVTAATRSRDPLELAGAAARERGRVVIVGAVPIDVPREPYYTKELDLVLSRSYGPGRYDPTYEEKGQDYPYGFVRWTEGRNMAAFLESVARGGVRPHELTTHRFPLEQAEQAYAIISGVRQEPHLGIVLQYSERPDLARRVAVSGTPVAATGGRLRVAFAGAGSFARSQLLPRLKGRGDVRLTTVATSRGSTSTDVARKFGFAEASTDALQVAGEPGADAQFVATRHDLHARLTIAGLESGKHVFVEKPLALDAEELDAVHRAAARSGRVLQVGFNRRFSPLAVRLRQALARAEAPTLINYRVNAGPLPGDHWLLDPRVGGGRVVGECCHFVDLIQFLAGERVTRVQAASTGDESNGAMAILLELGGGAVANLIYQANAAPGLAKERIEAFAGGHGGILDDWKSVEILDGRRRKRHAGRGQAKGFAEELQAFVGAIETGEPAVPLDDLISTTAATLAVVEALRSRTPVEVG